MTPSKTANNKNIYVGSGRQGIPQGILEYQANNSSLFASNGGENKLMMDSSYSHGKAVFKFGVSGESGHMQIYN